MIVEELREIVGHDRVSDDPAELYCYSFDSSYIRGNADYVVRPQTTEEISKIIKVAAAHHVPIVPRGSASGLTGGSVPVKGGIVIDMGSMNHILEVEVDNLQVLIEPGVIHRALNNELIKHGFFFPPDPGSSDMCTVGGLIANGGSGMHSVKYGTVKDYVMALEVVLPNGEIINTGCKAPKTSSGYDLTRLFVGSEGTLGIITKARLKIHPLPETKAILVATFDRIEDAGRTAVTVLSSGVVPAAMEIMDGSAIDAVQKIDPSLGLPDVEAMLLFEVDGYKEAVARQTEKICQICERFGGKTVVAKNKNEEERLWAARRLVGVAITRLNPGKVRVYEAEDIGVPIKQVPVHAQEDPGDRPQARAAAGHIRPYRRRQPAHRHRYRPPEPGRVEAGPRGEGRHLRGGAGAGRHGARGARDRRHPGQPDEQGPWRRVRGHEGYQKGHRPGRHHEPREDGDVI